MGRRLRIPFVLDAAVVSDEADMARLNNEPVLRRGLSGGGPWQASGPGGVRRPAEGGPWSSQGVFQSAPRIAWHGVAFNVSFYAQIDLTLVR